MQLSRRTLSVGLARRLFAGLGSYGERLGNRIGSLSVWQSLLRRGWLELYILGNKQNYREAIPDQGGTRKWEVRCGLRQRRGGFDDAGLYRFACGFNTPAELVHPALLEGESGSWLRIRRGSGVLPLNANREGDSIQVDFYNTLKRRTSFVLEGPATVGRRIEHADMLGRIGGPCPKGKVEIGPETYLKVVIG